MGHYIKSGTILAIREAVINEFEANSFSSENQNKLKIKKIIFNYHEELRFRYSEEYLKFHIKDLLFLSWSFDANQQKTKIDVKKSFFSEFQTTKDSILDKNKGYQLLHNNQILFILSTLGYNEKNFEDD